MCEEDLSFGRWNESWFTDWVCAAPCSDIRSSANDSFPVFGYRLKSCKKRKKKNGEKKGHDQMKLDWALLFVAKQLGVDSTSSLFSQHVQDVVWHRKPYLKVDGREGRSPVQDRGDVRFCCGESESRQSDPARHILCFSSSLCSCSMQPVCMSLSVLPEELMFSAQWTHWPQLCWQKHLTLSPSPASLRTP